VPYKQAVKLAHRGDLAFFHGTGAFSRIIAVATGSPTHVALVDVVAEDDLTLLESTTLNRFSGKRGVQRVSLAQKIEEAPESTVWLARLLPAVREALDWALADRYVYSILDRPYDYWQAVGSALGQYLPWLPSVSLKNALYCSELAAGVLRAGKAVPATYDPTPTPRQLAQWPIYESVVRIAGPPRPFPEDNAAVPYVHVLR
jgi:hypothetical protein